MHKVIRLVAVLLALLSVSMLSTPTALAKDKDAGGLSYEIVYLNPVGDLVVDETGGTYYFNWGRVSYVGGTYDEADYGTYPVFFIGDTMLYEIHLKNTGNRTYGLITVVCTQEYYDVGLKGVPMPGDPTKEWVVKGLKPGEEVVLRGQHYAAPGTQPGLDQMHLKIYPGKRQYDDSRILIDDNPEASVYCPP